MHMSDASGARKQALFREINEELRSGRHRRTDDQDGLVCECANALCTKRIEVSRRAYEAVRADPRCFLVAPGHEQEEVDLVVERTADYVLVKSVGRRTEDAHR
jgi:hypothetical protein